MSGSFAFLSLGMLLFWLWTNQKKLAAEREIRKLNADKRDITRSLAEIETRLLLQAEKRTEDDSYTTLAHLLNRPRKE